MLSKEIMKKVQRRHYDIDGTTVALLYILFINSKNTYRIHTILVKITFKTTNNFKSHRKINKLKIYYFKIADKTLRYI